jgi:small subunit ribosomal protein S6
LQQFTIVAFPLEVHTYGGILGQSQGKEVFSMHKYEVIFILHPDLDDTTINEMIEKVQGWITGAGGTVEKVDRWGKKRLAYQIRKQRDGYYVLINAHIPADFNTELERNLQIQESVMRFMIIQAQ